MKLLTTTLILAIALGSGAQAIDPADYTGLVAIDTVQVSPGATFTVDVWIRNNNVNISALTLPIKFDNEYLTLDSMSVAGTVWTGDFAAYSVIDNIDQTARLTVLPSEIEYPLPSVSVFNGVIGRLHFSLDGNAKAMETTIDSVYADTVVAGDIHVYTRVDVSDNTGENVYLPDFEAGLVEILGPTGVDDIAGSGLPTEYALAQNYPNPFNPTTVIAFDLPRSGRVRLDVFNILGQQVDMLIDEWVEAGRHEVDFDATGKPSGIYFYRLQHEEGTLTRKMIMLK